MFIVPIRGDQVELNDDSLSGLTVNSYTNIKEKPAVYLRGDSPRGIGEIIWIETISAINGVKVKFNTNDKLLEALGPFKRTQHLPQVGDTIKLDGQDSPVVIKRLSLHNRLEGLTRGLLVCGEDACYSIADIIEIERKVGGTSAFNRAVFLKLYKDYLPSR